MKLDRLIELLARRCHDRGPAVSRCMLLILALGLLVAGVEMMIRVSAGNSPRTEGGPDVDRGGPDPLARGERAPRRSTQDPTR